MSFGEEDEPVQTLPTHRADQSLTEGGRLRNPHGCLEHPPSHRRDRPVNICRVDPIPFMEHEAVRRLGGYDRAALLDGPVRCRMLGHIPMDDPPRADVQADGDMDHSETCGDPHPDRGALCRFGRARLTGRQ